MGRKRELDEIDIGILNVLQKDASIKNKDLAKEIGLSPGPTLVRVANLVKNKYIHKRTSRELNWSKLGFNYRCVVRLAISKTNGDSFKKKAKKVPGIRSMYEMSRDTHPLGNVTHLSVYCIFKSEEEFVSAWSDLVNDTQYTFDFQVWNIKRTTFQDNPIPIY